MKTSTHASIHRVLGAWGAASLVVLAWESQAQQRQAGDPELFYYGWQGQKVALEESVERIGVTFTDRRFAVDMNTFLATDARFQRAGTEETARNADLGNTVILRMTDGLTRDDVRAAREALRGRTGVESVHAVYKHGLERAAQGLEVRESLLTDFISVIVDARVPEQQVLDLFAQDGLEIVWKSDYSAIGKIGYRVRVTPTTRVLTTETVLDIANRYHEHPRIRQAAPAFAPLYEVQTSAPNDTYYINPVAGGVQWYYQDLQLDQAFTEVYGVNNFSSSNRIVIAILDNGVTLNYTAHAPNSAHYKLGTGTPPPFPQEIGGHPDLVGNQWKNAIEDAASPQNQKNNLDDDANGYPDDFWGWDFAGSDPTQFIQLDPTNFPGVYGDPIPFPDHYGNPIFDGFRRHGTAAAGTLAAVTNNNSIVPGICPSCLLMPVRYHVNTYEVVNTTYGSADAFYVGRAELAIRYAAGIKPNGGFSSTKADVIALMMAVETYDPLIHAAVQAARGRGCLIVCPTGNNNMSLDSFPLFPAVWPEVIAVGASDINDRRSLFDVKDGFQTGSNYGWPVDVLGPSMNDDATPGNDGIFSTSFETTYTFSQGGGTSQAMPMVAGVASLVLTKDPILGPGQVQAILQATAVDLVYTYNGDVATTGRDQYTGHGRVNAYNALLAVKNKQRWHVAVPDATRIGGKRSVLFVDEDGMMVMDGRVTPLASTSDLTEDPASGEFIVKNGAGTVVARLDPSWSSEFSQFQWPTLYLKGTLMTTNGGTVTPPAGSFVIKLGTTVVAYIDGQGNMKVKGSIIQAASIDTLGVGNHIVELPPGSTTATVQNAINAAVTGDIIIVPPGNYGALTVGDQAIILRSQDPFDPDIVSRTIIQAGSNQRAVTFSNNAPAGGAILGFTIQGNGTSNSGGITGGSDRVRVLYNVFINNKSTSGGGAINGFHLLIEGNTFGRLNQGNSAASGGALNNCDGVIRKNVFAYNSASSSGGVAYGCDGIFVQNFVYKNNAANGGAFASSAPDILSNIFYDNLASQNGGALYSLSSAIIEHNVFYSNDVTSGTGGGTYGSYGTIRNNIYYQNTGGQFVGGTTPNYSFIDVGANPGGTGNIGLFSNPPINSPGFVSVTLQEPAFIYDDFNDGNYDGWTVNGSPTVWSAANGYMERTAGTGAFWKAQTNPDYELWFSYYTTNTSEKADVYLRLSSGTLRLLTYSDALRVLQANGGPTTTLGTYSAFPTLPNIWYAVYVKIKGTQLEIWRGQEGQPLQLVTNSVPGVTLTTTTQLRFIVSGSSTAYRFDNIKLHASYNLDEFLQLSGSSPCIDFGQPLAEGATFRDFGDQLGPLDGNGDGEEVPDIGGDEFPTPPAASHWWKRF